MYWSISHCLRGRGGQSEHEGLRVMRGHRFFCCVVGTWKIENWHVYRLRVHRSVRHPEKPGWVMWDRLM